MKKTLLIALACLSLCFSACSSEEGKLKKMALEMGQKKFSEVIRQEAAEFLPDSEWLRQSYVELIDKNSEVEVEEVKFQGDNLAVVSVVVVTYPYRFRRTLLKVAGAVDVSKTRRFSFGEALGLVAAQSPEKNKPSKQPLTVYKFSKGAEGWVAQ